MDFFELNIDKDLFQKTNYNWNNLGLNSPWSIGYVIKLISSRSFRNKEEWIKHYFESGKERQRLIKGRLDEKNAVRVLDYTKPLFYKDKTDLGEDVIREMLYLNGHFGRTEEELLALGEYMYEKIKEKNPNTKLTLKLCQQCVYYRVICETWNGIIGREINTIKILKAIYPNLEFVKTTEDADFRYGVDYEVYNKEILLVGLQIKPKSYKNAKTQEVVNVKKTNDRKNHSYSSKFNIPVVYIYSTVDGKVEKESLLELSEIIKPH